MVVEPGLADGDHLGVLGQTGYALEPVFGHIEDVFGVKAHGGVDVVVPLGKGDHVLGGPEIDRVVYDAAHAL